MKSLPQVNLAPLMRDKATFHFFDAMSDEDGNTILTLCCEGMNVHVTINDFADTEEMLKRLAEYVTEERELRA